MEESLEQVWNDHEFNFGYAGFKVAVGHPSGDVEQASGYTHLQFRVVVQTREKGLMMTEARQVKEKTEESV